ncbi:isochorismatase family protein, partial [Nocardia sp.]
FCEGSPFADFIEGLAPNANEFRVTKSYPSAFFGTTLHSYLTAQRVDTALIAGLSTSGCVRATALDALQHGFVPIVVEDAVGDRDRRVHKANLFDIAHKIGEVWALDRAVEYLGGLGSDTDAVLTGTG